MGFRLFLSEVFVSIQGEGTLVGTPSFFVRTSGCNLRCHFCDTPYASWAPEGRWYTGEELALELERHPKVRHVVLTGGEPMLQKGLPAYSRALKEQGLHVTVETAGTLYQDLAVDLFSISPKLASSTPDDTRWLTRHDNARMRLDVIRALMRSAEYQLKFVVSRPEDLTEIDELTAELAAPPERVLLMPEGRSTQELDAVAEWLVPECLTRGALFCDRLQVRLFGDTRGT